MVFRGNKKRLINSQSFPKFPNPAERANVQVSTTKTIRSLLVTGLTSTLPRRTKEETFRASPRFLLLTQSPPGWKSSPFQQGRVGSGRAGRELTAACGPGGSHHTSPRTPTGRSPSGSELTPRPAAAFHPNLKPRPGPGSLGHGPSWGGGPRNKVTPCRGGGGGQPPLCQSPPASHSPPLALAHSHPRGQPRTSDDSARLHLPGESRAGRPRAAGHVRPRPDTRPCPASAPRLRFARRPPSPARPREPGPAPAQPPAPPAPRHV